MVFGIIQGGNSWEQNQAELRAAGIDAVVSITTDPVDLVARKMADEGLSTPALSDPTLAVTRIYATNQYGMMGTSRNGHSFILVGPDGQIDWRADYGGAPDYTMYLPTQQMLADLARERAVSRTVEITLLTQPHCTFCDRVDTKQSGDHPDV